MPDEKELPWDALLESEGEVPWNALREFASALPGNPDLLEDLGEVYDKEWSTVQDHKTYADLYIPAIIALAASDSEQIEEEDAERWGRFLIDKLRKVNANDDDTGTEVMSAACGSLGPAVLPQVLDVIQRISPGRGGWFHLWALTQLAARTEDPELKERTVEQSVETLERAEDGELKPLESVGAAWTLARLEREEYAPLLRRVAGKAPGVLGGGGDIETVADYMEGTLDYERFPEQWERPVEEWLPAHVRRARRWYEKKEGEQEKASPAKQSGQGDSAGGPSPSPSYLREEPNERIINESRDVGRNDPCPCGSGRKYKHCCGKPGNR